MGGGQSRLNNSGGGRPPTAFRCPEIGSCTDLDLVGALAAWPDIPAWLRAALEWKVQHSARDLEDTVVEAGRLPLETIESIAEALLHALGVESEPVSTASGPERAVALLERLVRHVVERGWHRHVLGLGTLRTLVPAPWRADQLPVAALAPAEHAALTVAAFAVFREPLLLWTRAPALDYLGVNVRISVRQLWRGRRAA